MELEKLTIFYAELIEDPIPSKATQRHNHALFNTNACRDSRAVTFYKSKKMAGLDFHKALKTAKKACPSSTSSYESLNSTIFKTLNNSISPPLPTPATSAVTTAETASLLSNLTSNKINLIISDPNVETSVCLRIFDFLCKNQSLLSFKPDLHANLTLICRLIKSRKFDDAENLLKNVAVDQNYRYPFSSLGNWAENYCKESKIITKLMNMMLKVYSDHQMFDMAYTAFDYMKNNGIQIDERTCTVHLYALISSDQVGLSLKFFREMADTGIEVSVFSLTVMVNGLCSIGELKMARKLVEEMTGREVKPNIVTFNTLVDACAKRWSFEELDLVLILMQKEGIEFNDSTYKFLIDGYSSFGKIEEAERLVLEMHDKRFNVNRYLYLSVIRGYFRLKNVKGGVSLFNKMQDRGLSPNIDMFRSLIDDLCKIEEMETAEDLVIKMQKKGVELDEVIFNTLMADYRKSRMPDKSSKLQGMMEESFDVSELSNRLTDSEFKVQPK